MFAKIRKDATILYRGKLYSWPTAHDKEMRQEQLGEIFIVDKLNENRQSRIRGYSFPDGASVSKDFLNIIKRICG